MPLTETPPVDSFVASSARTVQLRLHGGMRDEELVAVPHGKHSVGAGPRCAVRLTDAGVRPLHCLIVHDADGLRVRRWSDETLLNGSPFDESPLMAGDLLSVGPIELEVVRLELDGHGWHVVERKELDLRAEEESEDSHEEPTELLEESADSGEAAAGESVEGETTDEAVDGPEEEVAVLTVDESDETIDETTLAEINESEVPAPPVVKPSAKRRRNRKLLAAWRRTREEYVALFRRIDELEQKVESLVADLHSSSSEIPTRASSVDDGDEISIWPAPEPTTPAHWVDERLQLIQQQSELVEANSALTEALAEASATLATLQLELEESKTALASLEDQLAESQASCRQFADEREQWQSQLTDLESMMGDHLARIHELEDDLEELKQRNSQPLAMPAEPTAVRDRWPTEPTVGEGYDDFIAAELADEEGVDSDEPYSGPAVWGAPSDILSPDDELDWRGLIPDQSAHFGGNESSDPYAWDSSLQTEVEPATATGTATLDTPAARDADDADVVQQIERVSDEVSEMMTQLEPMPLWGEEERQDEAVTDSMSSAAMSLADLLDEPRSLADKVAMPDDLATTDEVEEVKPEHTKWSVEIDTPDVTQEAATSPEPVDDTDAGPANSTEPRSFIERFSHLFETDGGTTSDKTSPELPVARSEESHSATPPASNDDEESIEEYMARMMQRLRGESPGSPTSQPGDDEASGNDVTSAIDGGRADEGTPVAEAPQELFVNLEQLRPKDSATFQATDLGAMRALANQSARQAIGIHRVRTLRRNALARFILSTLATASSLFFILDSPGWQSLQFVTACISCLAAIHWGWLTFTSLIEAAQAGAFDKVDEADFRAIESSNPSLPIDVTR